MIAAVAVAVGGAAGALGRYWMTMAVTALAGNRFPWGTLSVNVLGALLMGILYVIVDERMPDSGPWRALLITGGLGAFTTFSAFSIDALLLLQNGRVVSALAYVLTSVVVCLLAVAVGMSVMRML